MAGTNILSNILDVREVRPPTPQELEAAYEALKDATEAVASIGWLVREMAYTADNEEQPTFEAPTFELVGRLAVYSEDAFSRLDEMRGYVDDVRKNLTTLAEIGEPWGSDA
jgi:hypothetical protein